MTIFGDAGAFVNNTRWGGWRLSKPNQYTFSLKNPWYNHNTSLSLGFDTNMRNKFSFSLKFRF